MLPNLQADMMITAAVEEAEDIVVVEDIAVVEEVGMEAEVGMAQEAGDVTTIVEAGEDMVVTVSFCLHPHQGLLLFVLHREINVLTAYKTLRNLQVVVDTVDGIPILAAVKATLLADRDTAADIKSSHSMHYRVRQ